ncbi:hypothetical protein T11_17193, partial [Trichinella zimbabwensis]
MTINDEMTTHLTHLSSARTSNALKTGFQRCTMQITIAIKVPYHQYEQCRNEKVKKLTTRSRSRRARSTTKEDMQYMRFPMGPNS